MRRLSIPRIGVAACLVALALAGCGRRGPLEPPIGSPQTRAPQPDATALQAAQTRTLDDTDEPGLIQTPNVVYEQSTIAKLNSATKNPARPINAQPVDRQSTFFLDPLVK